MKINQLILQNLRKQNMTLQIMLVAEWYEHCSSYHRTKHSFYYAFKEPSNDHLWHLNNTGTFFFNAMERKVKVVLSGSVKTLADEKIASELLDEIGEDVIRKKCEELNEIVDYETQVDLLEKMLQKYVRFRGHAFAKRFTKLFISNKKQSGGGGKGQRTSFRDNSLQTCSK